MANDHLLKINLSFCICSRVTQYIDWIYKKIGGCEVGRACKSDCPFVQSRQDVIDTLDGSLASLGIRGAIQ